jgi:hypothetical protein
LIELNGLQVILSWIEIRLTHDRHLVNGELTDAQGTEERASVILFGKIKRLRTGVERDPRGESVDVLIREWE